MVRPRDPQAAPLAPVPEVRFANRYRGTAGVVPHVHDGTELVLVVRGTCRVRVPGDELTMRAGEVAVLPAGISHDQVDEGEVETLYVEFTAPARQFSERPRVLPAPLDGRAAGWIRQLVDLEPEPLPPAVRNGVALALLAQLAHGEQRDEMRRALHPGVVRALGLMEADLSRDLAVADLAAAAGLSASHLTALFRAQLGCGPLAWQQQQRLDLACRLLRNAYRPVAEVGAACGYPDTNYFARLFRRRFGRAPSEWRRQE